MSEEEYWEDWDGPTTNRAATVSGFSERDTKWIWELIPPKKTKRKDKKNGGT